MGEELVDQLTVRAASLDAVTVAGQHNMLPHRPLPQDAYAESDSSQRPATGPQANRACRRDEGRLTGTFFSITQKKVISPNDFASLDELARTLLAFVNRYNQTARPFNWKFTAADLGRLLDRISAREQTARKPAKLPEAA